MMYLQIKILAADSVAKAHNLIKLIYIIFSIVVLTGRILNLFLKNIVLKLKNVFYTTEQLPYLTMVAIQLLGKYSFRS